MLNLRIFIIRFAMEKKIVFFLGGYDLEMVTIKTLLDENGIKYEDKRLQWGARLSSYQEALFKYAADPEWDSIYGIELFQDISSDQIPLKYHLIDHHNDKENDPSSLEQVCTILGIEMDEHLLLVAANDKGYIPAMEERGATDEQIKEIRRSDRRAQGITEMDEIMADKAISNRKKIGDVTFVKSATSHFSTISDRLYPYEKLLVYTDEEVAFYGKDKDALKRKIEDHFKGLPQLYSGGGVSGYFGFRAKSENDKSLCNDVVNYLMNQQYLSIHSGHIFLFPFTWNNEDTNSPLKRLTVVNNGKWERVPLSKTIEDDSLYNELNYFYPFTHDILYDQEDGDSHIWHFERKQPTDHESVKYKITIGDGKKSYVLEVKHLNLNVYETGVGLLSIFTWNETYPLKEDILSINQFGRRLFPPFKADIDSHSEVAFSLEFLGLETDESYYEEFTDKTIQPNAPTRIVTQLVKEAINNIGEIKPVLDDRMFVMSWYKSSIPFSSESVYEQQIMGIDDFLYKFIFVDAGSPTCQNFEMRQALLREAVYPRWQQCGTLYGISRYSFQMLFSGSPPIHLIQTFETEYVRLVELVLVQRATILRFSGLLKLYGEEMDTFNVIYGQYINFLNRFRLPEVTAQEQGIELYDMLCKKLRIQEQAEHLDKQFNEREDYLELINQKKLEETTSVLNIIAGVAVPFSIVSAVFGLFYRDSFVSDSSLVGWWSGLIALFISFVFVFVFFKILGIKFLRRGKKSWK